VKKAVFLLNVGNYAPEITALTYPWIERYAAKIGAAVHTITERRFPDWDVDYEKLQIYALIRQLEVDFALYLDSDALVHPELPDLSAFTPRDTVAHNGSDFGAIRWRDDAYFRRDGRRIGSCNWCTMAWADCRDLWRPLDDLTPAEAVARITPTAEEQRPPLRVPDWRAQLRAKKPEWTLLEEQGPLARLRRQDGLEVEIEMATGVEAKAVISAAHLVSDFALSRNIARFGLKFTTLGQLWPKLGMPTANFFHHEYTSTLTARVAHLAATLERWKLA